MPDLTWLGWIFLIDMVLSIPIHLFRAMNGTYTTRTPLESFFMGLFTVLYMIGFLTVGFVH